MKSLNQAFEHQDNNKTTKVKLIESIYSLLIISVWISAAVTWMSFTVGNWVIWALSALLIPMFITVLLTVVAFELLHDQANTQNLASGNFR